MNEDSKEKDLEWQEIWVKAHFSGYSCNFYDKNLWVDINIENPDYPEKSAFTGTTLVFAPINADEYGRIDLTQLLHTLLLKMKENPDSKVKCYATGFAPQMHFSKELLSTPIPKELINMFGEKKNE